MSALISLTGAWCLPRITSSTNPLCRGAVTSFFDRLLLLTVERSEIVLEDRHMGRRNHYICISVVLQGEWRRDTSAFSFVSCKVIGDKEIHQHSVLSSIEFWESNFRWRLKFNKCKCFRFKKMQVKLPFTLDRILYYIQSFQNKDDCLCSPDCPEDEDEDV
jgi:hypothetical protein